MAKKEIRIRPLNIVDLAVITRIGNKEADLADMILWVDDLVIGGIGHIPMIGAAFGEIMAEVTTLVMAQIVTNANQLPAARQKKKDEEFPIDRAMFDALFGHLLNQEEDEEEDDDDEEDEDDENE